jgi:hypothetical protein
MVQHLDWLFVGELGLQCRCHTQSLMPYHGEPGIADLQPPVKMSYSSEVLKGSDALVQSVVSSMPANMVRRASCCISCCFCLVANAAANLLQLC